MKAFLILIFITILPIYALAEEKPASGKEIPVPEISYAQKVEIVVPLQKNPDVLSATVEQDNKKVMLSLMVSNTCTLKNSKILGHEFLMRTKTITLDDPAGKEKAGKGLYDYTIKIVRANGKIVIEGGKKPDEEEEKWF